MAKLPKCKLLADLDIEQVPVADVFAEVDAKFHMNIDAVGEVKFEPDKQFALLVTG